MVWFGDCGAARHPAPRQAARGEGSLMGDEIQSQDEPWCTCARVTIRVFWSMLLCGIVLVAAWPLWAQAPNSANELARVIETSLRAKDLDTVSKHVSAQPTAAKAFMRVLEARLGKFRDWQKLRVYAVPAEIGRAHV